MREVLGAIAFLTRLPVPAVNSSFPLHRLAAWFPVAGALVGILTGATYLLARWLGLPPMAAALFAIAIEMLVTGALHPDGLADTADGMAGSTVERRLEIMKDPRLGAYGGIALFITLTARLTLIPFLPYDNAVPLLVAAHMVCRFAPVWALAHYSYARPGGGTGAGFTDTGWRELVLAGIIALVGAWILVGPLGLAAAGLAWLAAGGLTAYLSRKLGGITGDVCGAVTEIALLAFLIAIVAQTGV